VLYRDLYAEEVQDRELLRSAVSIPLALLTILGSGIAYLFRGLPVAPDTLLGCWHTIALAGAALAFCIAAVFLIMSYHGHVYERVPSPNQIKTYEEALNIYHGSSEAGRAEATATFQSFLRSRYTEAADRNMYTNIKRSAYLYRANAAVIACLVLAALAVPPHIILASRQSMIPAQRTDCH